MKKGAPALRKADRNLDTNPYLLPADLPVPADDLACDHLRGMRIPSVSLKTTTGESVNIAEISATPTVFFFYPETGRPGAPIPKDWNQIPGARGCTPQSCGFRDQYREFKELGFEVFGVSAQSLDEQIDFAKRNNLPYELLNDSDFRLTNALRLPTFKFESKTFIKRLALVVKDRSIERVFYPVFPADKNAETVLNYLRGKSQQQLSGITH
jgi:peroxiredoxin